MTGDVHVIDDDAVRDSLSALLTGAGFSVCAYPSAAAFLDEIDKAPGGVVVTCACPVSAAWSSCSG